MYAQVDNVGAATDNTGENIGVGAEQRTAGRTDVSECLPSPEHIRPTGVLQGLDYTKIVLLAPVVSLDKSHDSQNLLKMDEIRRARGNSTLSLFF